LLDPVWDVITAGWRDKPKQRCELSVVCDIFSTSAEQEVQNIKPGDLNTQNDRNLTTAERSQTLKQGYSNV
jgi:hypothetical protein